MATKTYESHNHIWSFDDRGGDRSLPEPEAACRHCGQTWHQFQRVPSKCVPRPVFASKAETAPESKPEAIPGIRRVNGHEWLESSPGTVVVGEPCRKCQIKYGTLEAVWTCAGTPVSAESIIKKRDPVEAITELAVQQQVAKKSQRNEYSDSEAWVQFACAFASTESSPKTAADLADDMLEEYRKRFPQ